MAGAGGFEPPPSSLTVRCPTDWTTPQRVAIPHDCREALELGGLGRRKMRARLRLRYHERDEPREPREKIELDKNCIKLAFETINCQEQAHAQKCRGTSHILLNFSTGRMFSELTKPTNSRKSVGMDVAFQKVLLETKRSKLARVFALPG